MDKKNRTFIRFITGCLLTLTAVFPLSGCGQSTAPNTGDQKQPSAANSPQSASSKAPDGKIKVVAAENFYGEVAQAVGGDQVEVQSILTNPNVDPHDYEPTPDASKTVNDSQLVIYNGIGYDSWMDKLLKASSTSKGKSIINVGSDLAGKKEGDNPHVWYDPNTIPKVAAAIADDLAKLNPGQAHSFKQRADQYIASLSPLKNQVEKLKKSEGVSIDVSEPVFDYMAKALNFKVNNPTFAKSIEEGNDPSPRDIGQIQSDIQGKKVKMFIVNSQAQNSTISTIVDLAKSSGVPIVQVTETEPMGKDYLQWMVGQLQDVEKALNVK
ncbi:metal ABC transporter solute-binding protein, Zn/Mn family [Aneurinibacillus terranovensis]|uniref:metal ABC transporter solute-binding protein, Zn/Mn family n=1 Tax=Aneurinibacillus terranovensis TaxID=278991 RepID=UPI0004278474|nr:zinc ABC transporter substrate-binding protein [Aneurinibacillus terranovensis]